jgi:hypothetical protein
MSLDITVPEVSPVPAFMSTIAPAPALAPVPAPAPAPALKSHQIFGIFLTIIGLVFVIPKLNSYYNENIADKQNSKYMERTTFENILLFAGVLFLVYGIREIFFNKSTF